MIPWIEKIPCVSWRVGLKKLFWASLALFVLILTVNLVFLAFSRVNTSSECLAFGYSESRVAWDFKQYCIKRTIQTDVVVPLELIRAKPFLYSFSRQ